MWSCESVDYLLRAPWREGSGIVIWFDLNTWLGRKKKFVKFFNLHLKEFRCMLLKKVVQMYLTHLDDQC